MLNENNYHSLHSRSSLQVCFEVVHVIQIRNERSITWNEKKKFGYVEVAVVFVMIQFFSQDTNSLFS